MTARAFVAKFGTAFACLFVLVGVGGICIRRFWGHHLNISSVGCLCDFSCLCHGCHGGCRPGGVASAGSTSVYKAVLPVMLALLTLLPFVGDYLGSLAGGAMIACYDVCGMLFLFFIVDAAHGHRQQSYLLSSVYMGGSNGFLALGLGIGLLVNYLSGDYDISLMTLLAFVAMYPLGIAFVMVMRRSMQGVRPAADGSNLGGQAQAQRLAQDANPSSNGALGRHEQAHEDGSRGDEGAVDNASDSPDAAASIPEERSEVFPVEPDWEAALHSFAERYGLTKRETEICSYLVRGRSAKRIAEELFISENTVWTHTKNVYAKTKVSGKDDLMNLFEDEAFGDRASQSRHGVFQSEVFWRKASSPGGAFAQCLSVSNATIQS